MIEDESDVFEINDFTTASEWERFIAKLEELIHEWKLGTAAAFLPLTKGELSTGEWEEATDVLNFADFKFLVTRHFLKKDDETDAPQHPEGATAENPEPEAGAERPGKDDAKTDETDDGEKESIPLPWQDMMSLENDFPSRAHCLSRWYGLRDFVTLAPAPDMDNILSESRLNILLSSVAVALNNTSCQVPVFVQAHDKWRKLYFGQFEIPGFRTSFEMVHLRCIPHQYGHLAGLLDVFKAKLASPTSPLPPVSVAVRFTYVLQDWVAYTWPQLPPDMDSATGAEVGVTEFGELPFGACEDPVSDLHLSTTWPSLSEEMIVDNDVYSDLDPQQAPLWCVRVRLTENPQCLLGDYLEEFVLICRRQESNDQLLGKSVMDAHREKEVDVSPALQRLTDPGYNIPSLGTVVTKATSKLQIKPEEAPIAKECLNQILLFLFPDAKSDPDPVNKGLISAASTPCEDGPILDGIAGGAARDGAKEHTPPTPTEPVAGGDQTDQKPQLLDMFKQFKSAPPDSLTYKLAICMCIVNHSYGGLGAVAHLWQEFVLEMRYRWENNYSIPDLDPGSPNMGCSILHQKLQMLNCCIERKKARESTDTDTHPASAFKMPKLSRLDSLTNQVARDRVDSSASERGEFSASSDDEFYECDENSSQNSDRKTSAENMKPESKSSDATKDSKVPSGECAMETDQSDSKVPGSSSQSDLAKGSDSQSGLKMMESESDFSFTDSFTHQPDGRSRVLEEMRLLTVDEALYIPLTQEPAPMTEDMLEEHAEVLAKLGTSSEGAHLRARMQSACLLSDMEAFKAANPGCILGDFVRWYSPRDWLEEDEEDEDGNVVKKGQLSPRMQIPGNMWLEVWQSAKPVPARRQRRLFDDTKEAEKVLHWLASMNPADVAARLMPMLIHAAIVKLMEQEEKELSVMKTLMNQITNRATKAMRSPRIEVKRFEELVRQLTLAETVVTRAQSLLTKFSEEKQDVNISGKDLQQLVASLLELPEVNIVGASRGPVGTIIHRLFAAAQKASYMITEDDDLEDRIEDRPSVAIPDFPAPVGKEYILRTTLQRPASWSRSSPQRMYCVLLKEDFRLAGAFTSDTTFQ